jgi:hypothetical protein
VKQYRIEPLDTAEPLLTVADSAEPPLKNRLNSQTCEAQLVAPGGETLYLLTVTPDKQIWWNIENVRYSNFFPINWKREYAALRCPWSGLVNPVSAGRILKTPFV